MIRLTSHGQNCANMLSVTNLPEYILTDYESSGEDRDEFEDCNHITHASEECHTHISLSIFNTLLEDWMYGYRTIYTRRHYHSLMTRISDFVNKGKTLNILLPGFPCKNPKKNNKVLGATSDFSEYLALCTLIVTARKIEGIYPHGISITIVCDFQNYDMCNRTSEEDHVLYRNSLIELIRNIGADDIIKLVSLLEYPEFQALLGVKSEYVRVSIHHHHPTSGKFPIDFYKKYNSNNKVLRPPWRHVIMFDTMRSEFIIDHKNTMLACSEQKSPVLIVKYKENDWLLIRIYLRTNGETVSNDINLHVTMIKHGSGIMIENKSKGKGLKSSIIDPQSLTSMIKEFGVVILRGFDDFKNEDEIIDFYSERGKHGLIAWICGSARHLKKCGDVLPCNNETEPIPIHWDQISPVQYVDGLKSSFNSEESSCKEFMLYCNRNSQKRNETTNTFVDAYTSTLALPGDLKEKWKNTVLVYESKLASAECGRPYCNDKLIAFEYPLIQRCEWTNKDVLRWGEIWNEDEHPGTNQFQSYTIKEGSQVLDTPADLEKEIKKRVLDERFVFTHHYKEGDQVFVNNYTILHGRSKGCAAEKLLWRLQILPPRKQRNNVNICSETTDL